MTTNTQRVNLESAFVLHRRPYRNTSLIVDLLTRQHGRVTVVARSARGPKSRYRGVLECFSPLLVSWSRRGEMGALSQVESAARSYQLSGHALPCGFYLNELLTRLLHRDDPHPGLFDYYQQGLQALEQGQAIQPSLRRFEKYLLAELGYGLVLQKTAHTHEPIIAEGYYQYIPDEGFIAVLAEQITDQVVKQANIFSGRSLLALANDQLTDEAVVGETTLRDAKRLMRMVLSRHLGDKPLKTRELL